MINRVEGFPKVYKKRLRTEPPLSSVVSHLC